MLSLAHCDVVFHIEASFPLEKAVLLTPSPPRVYGKLSPITPTFSLGQELPFQISAALGCLLGPEVDKATVRTLTLPLAGAVRWHVSHHSKALSCVTARLLCPKLRHCICVRAGLPLQRVRHSVNPVLKDKRLVPTVFGVPIASRSSLGYVAA